MVATVHTKAPDDIDHRPIESLRNENHDVSAQEVKSAIKKPIENELMTMVEGSLEDILRTLLHNAESGTRSVVYIVVEQVMLALLRKKVVRDTLNADIVNYCNTDVAANKLSKRLMTSSSFMTPITTFVRQKMDTAMESKNHNTALESKR